MWKKDLQNLHFFFLLKERIVSALDLKLSSEELGTYCQMWPLRPFINDEIVQQAWEHIH